MTNTCRGIHLRYVLVVVLLDAGRPLTLGELLQAVLETHGFEVAGRPQKTLADALRWERRKGRVERVGRGRYQIGSMPRSTQWWIRSQVAKRALVARTLAETESAA